MQVITNHGKSSTPNVWERIMRNKRRKKNWRGKGMQLE